MKWTLLILSLFWLNLGFCQKIALKDAISDLEFLNHAVVEGHPVNYEPGHPVNITSVLEKVKTFKEDSISDRAFRQLLKEAFYEIGCIHTSCHQGKLSKKEWKRRTQNKGVGLDYFPIDLASSAGRIYAIKQGRTGSPEREGMELAAINGVAVPDLLRELYKNGASDGGGDAFSKFYLKQTALSWLIAGHFDYPSEYKVDFKNGQKVAVETVHFPQAPFDYPVAPCRTLGIGKANVLCTEGPIMVLRITSFSKKDVRFIRKAFREIGKHPEKPLVLDLRNNLGGNRKAAVELTKYLTESPFTYSILQPKLSPRKYLSSTGKRQYFLSKLKYNVGNMLCGKMTPLGRKFTYTYKPKRESFNGKLFVITDGFTASAATMVTTWLKQQDKAAFVGQQAGGGYNGNNGGSFPIVQLPNSKVEIRFPVYRLILDPNSQQRTGLIPDVVVEYGIDDILQAKDLEMEAVIKLCR